ncbi:hypothetical protein ACQEV4_19345 [Streptomyces shenzhenensis]|uniref:hypothetical protein n=1 Tax=Streptomyces shenzhenensis TaxID=943815 RepID=UPI003D8B71ED
MTPPPVGDVAGRRAALEGLIAHGDTAQPTPSDVTVTDHHLLTDDGEQILLRWYTRQGIPDGPGPAV